jgi:hypothetical protein
VRGLLEYINGESVVFKFTVPGFMMEIVPEFPIARTLAGALETRERFPAVKEPVGPWLGIMEIDTESVGAILIIRIAA